MPRTAEREPAPAPTLRAESLTKRFGDFTANDAVSLSLEPGRVHVLLGENGAGKSTFMNMLYGHLRPDDGRILLDELPVAFASPAAALAAGVGMVHQHFSLVPSYSVAENVVLGYEPGRVWHNPRTVRAQVAATVERLGWDLDVDRRVDGLPVSAQQRVEILKLLHRGARVLLLDEPTALLAPAEIESLLDVIEGLRAGGASVLLVTHKLREVERVADEVTVIRRGRITATYPDGDLDASELARAMTGRDSIPTVTAEPRTAGEPVLELERLSVSSGHGTRVVNDVDLLVRAGEIVGLAAVEGNGQHELVQAISGVIKPDAGSIRVAGATVSAGSPLRARAAGLAVVPADRRHDGVVGDMNLTENLALDDIAARRGLRGGFLGLLETTALRRRALEAVERYDIRPGRIDALARSLSGGNMQKLVIAREVATTPRCLLAVSPTWGLDVGAVADVQQRLVQLRDEGCGILLSSPDLDEIMALSDRVVVMFRGMIMYEADRAAVSADDLSKALMGIRPTASAA